MPNRKNERDKWLYQALANRPHSLQALTGDASFRHYYRLQTDDGVRILMDAPPEKEPIHAFLRIAQLLKSSKIPVPEIYVADEKKGFVLLEDFGDTLLLNALEKEGSKNKDAYYYSAIALLLQMQTCKSEALPCFDVPFMLQEMHIFTQWFLGAYLKLSLSEAEKELVQTSCNTLAQMVNTQPKTFIHRDYHSRNIMLIGGALGDVPLTNKEGLGIIDFQDAMFGPATYDLVSLLKDCYIQFPREFVLRMLTFFYENSSQRNLSSKDDFIKAFDLCGLQRHLKVLGVFSRLYLRDNKPNYLKDLPLTLHYVLDCLEHYEELRPLFDFMRRRIQLP